MKQHCNNQANNDRHYAKPHKNPLRVSNERGGDLLSGKGTKNLADFVMNDQVTFGIHGRSIAVYEYEAFSTEITEKTGRRINREAGARDNHQISRRNRMNGAGNDIVIQAFFIEHDIRFDPAAAGTARNGIPAVADVFRRIELSTFHTVVPVNAAMQFKNTFRSEEHTSEL